MLSILTFSLLMFKYSKPTAKSLIDGQDVEWGGVQVAEVVTPSRQSLDAGPGEITAAPEDGAAAHSGDGGTSRSSLLHGVGARRLGLVSGMRVCDDCYRWH